RAGGQSGSGTEPSARAAGWAASWIITAREYRALTLTGSGNSAAVYVLVAGGETPGLAPCGAPAPPSCETRTIVPFAALAGARTLPPSPGTALSSGAGRGLVGAPPCAGSAALGTAVGRSTPMFARVAACSASRT